MATFIYFSFPITDIRFFLPESNKLSCPSWEVTRAGREFVRSFGKMGLIRYAGNPKWAGAEPMASASSALGFSPYFNKQKFGSQKCQFSVKCCNRRLLSDGKGVHHVDIGFRLKKKDISRKISHKDIQRALNDLMNVQVTIPKRSKNINNCKLFEAGEFLAKHYLKSSTKISEKKLKKHENWWVSCGVPTIFLELDRGVQFGSLRGTYNKSFKSKMDGVTISYIQRLENNRDRAIDLWVLEKNSKYTGGRTYLRHIRRHILRLHSEWECMKNIYVLLHEQKKIKRIPGSEEYEELKSYIFKDTELLLNQEFDNLDPHESDTLDEAMDYLKKVNTNKISLIKTMRESFIKDVSDNNGLTLNDSKKKKTVFISYSHKDEELKDRLVKHLNILEMENLLELWDDHKIQVGEDWFIEIKKKLERADIVIMLISVDSLTSKFIQREEVPRILKRRKEEGVLVVPLIVKPCLWDKVNWLAEMQITPKDGKSLMERNKFEIEAELVKLGDAICTIIKPNEQDIKNEATQ
jgi:hypothetical protein